MNQNSLAGISCMRNKLTLKLVLLLGVLTLPGFARAGNYVVAEGELCEVCRLVVKNLNRDPRWKPCERSLGDDSAIITRPEWIVHDPVAHIPQLKQFHLLLEGHKQWISQEEFIRLVEWKKSYNHIGLRTTVVDIDNNGAKEIVALFRNGICEYTRRHSTALGVFNEGLTAIEEDITSVLTLGDYSFSEYGANWSYYDHDLFIMNGLTYIDKYYALKPFTIDIHRVLGARSERICRIKYVIEIEEE